MQSAGQSHHRQDGIAEQSHWSSVTTPWCPSDTTILNVVDLSNDQWLQVSMPVGNGGLEVRSARMLAPSAFLASAAFTFELQHSILPEGMKELADQLVVSI